MGNFWLDSEMKKLGELVEQGLPAGKIAALLKKTRNAIIGKCYRAGFQLMCSQVDGSRAARGPRGPYKKTGKQLPVAAPPASLPAVEQREARAKDAPRQPAPLFSSRVEALLALGPHDCKWPMDDNSICQEPRDEPLPYCTHHCRIAYNYR